MFFASHFHLLSCHTLPISSLFFTHSSLLSLCSIFDFSRVSFDAVSPRLPSHLTLTFPHLCTPDLEEDKDKAKERARRRVLNSSMLRDALEDHTEDPEVVYNMDVLKQKAIRKRKEIEE